MKANSIKGQLSGTMTVLLLTACIPAPAPAPDTTAPTLAQVTAVPTPTNDTTPSYTFSSNEAGTIIYGGSCSSATTSAIKGNNTVTFNTLAAGSYSDCTIKVKDAKNNTSAALAVSNFTIITITPRPLNDTRITACGDYPYDDSGIPNNNVNCSTSGSSKTTAGTDGDGDPVPAGQDAAYNHKSFSFTKLKADGTALATQHLTWNDAGSEEAGTKWSCVRDNVTGLTWEIKTNDGNLRDKRWTYSWYNSTGINDGGYPGSPDLADNCSYPTTRCDTEKYVADVNAAVPPLCGERDWRLPTWEELHSIIANDRISPAIDTAFFPNTASNFYWSSSPTPNGTNTAWRVDFNLGDGVKAYNKGVNYSVRLVRNSN